MTAVFVNAWLLMLWEQRDKNQRGSASASLRFVLQAPHTSKSLKGCFENWSLARLTLSTWAYETHCNDLL